MKIISTLFIGFALFLLIGAPTSAAVEIYSVASVVGTNNGDFEEVDAAISNRIVNQFGASTLYSIDPNNGAPTEIGPTGFYSCQGLDIHPFTDELYAVCNEPFMDIMNNEATTTNTEINGGQVLVRLNKNTGQGTKIGLLGGTIGLPFRGPFVSDISFRPDGTLYAHVNGLSDGIGRGSEDFSTSLEELIDNSIGTIDLTTGQFSLIGPTEYWDNYSAIGFLSQQSLFQCANDTFIPTSIDFNSLNPLTGKATFITQVVIPPPLPSGSAVIPSKDADDITGIFYAILGVQDIRELEQSPGTATNNIGEPGNYLIRINAATGDINIIGFIEDQELAFLTIAVKGKPIDVPTMSEYGLMATAVFLLGASVLYLRRRQAKLEI